MFASIQMFIPMKKTLFLLTILLTGAIQAYSQVAELDFKRGLQLGNWVHNTERWFGVFDSIAFTGSAEWDYLQLVPSYAWVTAKGRLLELSLRDVAWRYNRQWGTTPGSEPGNRMDARLAVGIARFLPLFKRPKTWVPQVGVELQPFAGFSRFKPTEVTTSFPYSNWEAGINSSLIPRIAWYPKGRVYGHASFMLPLASMRWSVDKREDPTVLPEAHSTNYFDYRLIGPELGFQVAVGVKL